MATQEDRSLSSGMSFPRWMKTKMNDRLDFEQSAFSPTELDDSFIYYYRNKTRGFSEPPKTIATTANLVENQQSYTAPINGNKPDFSKHTPSCQKYLKNSADNTTAQLVKYPSATKVKSSGTDDGFKGEAAMCGTSVIRVAHQMVAGKVIRGFNIQTKNDCDLPPEGFNPSLRRGSKSLPASPLSSPTSSPKSTRRVNKYFTGPFVDTENHGSWILSNLLSKRQTLSQSVGYIAEEDATNVKTVSSTTSVDDVSDGKKSQIFIPKPSELREMNFWSPTSM
ncbi:uncharacterized protein BDFB_001054 [Asbolus verrucosus]|uniref:Uncharacterized protein n=1 Tax=Asbolus verrucosus TaxID=1661398 RepID=A0A482VFP6_ASBVE|nr:uncharacterized protein BDFB_001054 [Asbolus verrucosus]